MSVLADGGKIDTTSNSLRVSGANSATILIAAATSYRNYHDVSGNPEALTSRSIANARMLPYESLRARHIAEHRRLFRRVKLDLGSHGCHAASHRPADRPFRFRQRSQSRRALLPVRPLPADRQLAPRLPSPRTLQGIWNDSMSPPWGSKYTININTEMNYWPAISTNLAEPWIR